MNVEIEEREGTAIARLEGEIDLANADDLRARLSASAGEECLVVDLAGVAYIDSAGIEMLFRLHADLRERSRLVVVAPPGSRAHRLLGLVALDEVGEVRESTDEALRACAGRAA